jgi:enoyl-CoA hydratase
MSNLLVEINDRIGVLTINRPDKLNALNVEVLNELKQVLQDLKNKKLVGLILTGSGEKAFIAGADIASMKDMSSSQASKFGELGQSVSIALESLPYPTIACVQGFALGGGFEMALACDFIFASDKAVFGLPEVKLGLIPGFGGTQRLARRTNTGLAKELIFSGRNMTAQEAFQRGVANQLFSTQEQMMKEVREFLKRVAMNSPLAIAQAKWAIDLGEQVTLEQGLRLEANSFSGLFNSFDMREGTSAFLEKRKAQFKGNKMIYAEKYKEIHDMIKKFSETEVGPLAMKIDHDGAIPQSLIQKLAENGFLGSYIPEEYGGAGLDYMSYALLIEELSRQCASTGVFVSAHTSLAVWPILAFGTQEQKKKYLPRLASGRNDWLFLFIRTQRRFRCWLSHKLGH